MPFVLNAFARSVEAARATESTERKELHRSARRAAARCFEAGNALVAQGAPDEAPDVLFGFLLKATPESLLWVYTKHDYRRAGVAQSLLSAAFPDGALKRFVIFHGGYAQRLRQKGVLYSPLSLSELGPVGPLGEHVLEKL